MPLLPPYEQLALGELWLQGTDRMVLSGLQRASKLTKVNLSQIDQEGALVLSIPTSLEELSVFHQAELDLAPLVNAPGLQHISLNDIRGFRNIDALLRLESLDRLTFAGCAMEAPVTNIIEALLDRGIQVTVYSL